MSGELPRQLVGKGELRRRLESAARGQGYQGPVILGLTGGEAKKHRGSDFLYIDHSYFRRGWEWGMFRLTRGWCHLTTVKKRPDDRLKLLKVQIEPWRKTGRRIVVIPPSVFQAQFVTHWTQETLARLAALTDRPVFVKEQKGGLRECLSDAWAVVSWASVAGVEAALMGVPVFPTELCPSYPVRSGPLERIETPEHPERHEWACSLAYASWHVSEIKQINLGDYDYSRRDDLP